MLANAAWGPERTLRNTLGESSDSPDKAGEQPCSQVPSVVPAVAGAALRGTMWSVLAMSKIGLAATVMGVCRRVSLCVAVCVRLVSVYTFAFHKRSVGCSCQFYFYGECALNSVFHGVIAAASPQHYVGVFFCWEKAK